MLTSRFVAWPASLSGDARRFDGGVAEWLNAAVSKTVSGVKPLTRVRIPPPPLSTPGPAAETTEADAAARPLAAPHDAAGKAVDEVRLTAVVGPGDTRPGHVLLRAAAT